MDRQDPVTLEWSGHVDSPSRARGDASVASALNGLFKPADAGEQRLSTRIGKHVPVGQGPDDNGSTAGIRDGTRGAMRKGRWRLSRRSRSATHG